MIFRTIFWFSMVVMLIPVKNDAQNHASKDVTVAQTVVLVQEIAGDLSGFCIRNPESCAFFVKLSAQYGARIMAHAGQLSSFVSDQQLPDAASSVITGSVAKSD